MYELTIHVDDVLMMFAKHLSNIFQTSRTFLCLQIQWERPKKKSTKHKNVWEMCENFTRKKKARAYQKKSEKHVFVCTVLSTKNGPHYMDNNVKDQKLPVLIHSIIIWPVHILVTWITT